ncbi:hypothetical protein EJ03DRAFT_354072 [Teratosphaeria nubilosa]|uniref:Uncharacterized protein n=1 Tax=Teratosphaeria nubilosa TaxID=161662 RepID=A0A6G1L0Z6_9PEZI|nr:hypothetical protein EJ03DRAFT_354072 [Teratosphaeria nubilosa]
MEDAGLDGVGIWNLLCNTTASSVSPSVSSALASISANLSAIAASAGFSPTGATVKSAGTAATISISLPLTGSNRTLTLTPASGVPATAADSTTPSPLIFSSVNASAGISISTNGSFIAASSLLTAFTSPESSPRPSSQTTAQTSAANSLPISSQNPTPASTIASSVPITSLPAVGISLSDSLTSSVATTTSTGIATGNDGVLTETVVVWEYVTVFAK